MHYITFLIRLRVFLLLLIDFALATDPSTSAITSHSLAIKHCDWGTQTCPPCDLKDDHNDAAFSSKPCNPEGDCINDLCDTSHVGLDGNFTCYRCTNDGVDSVCLREGVRDQCDGKKSEISPGNTTLGPLVEEKSQCARACKPASGQVAKKDQIKLVGLILVASSLSVLLSF